MLQQSLCKSYCTALQPVKYPLFAYPFADQYTYLKSPFAKGVIAFAATDNKTYYKMVGTYPFRGTLYKATLLPNPVDDRFVKELIKVFFTLLVKKRFVDIVKCV
jgi:hypothetical protein